MVGAMRCVLPLWFGFFLLAILGVAVLPAQNLSPVTFKVFPSDYEVFFQGDRLTYSVRGDGLRLYNLPAGAQRVNLTAPGSAPLSLNLEVKAGLLVQAKLEPRQGPLDWVAEAGTGKLPRSLTFSADGKWLFVALQGEPGVEVFEVPSLKKKERLAVVEPGSAGFSDVLVVGTEIWAVQRDGRIHAFDSKTLAAKDAPNVTGGGNVYLTEMPGGKVAAANWDNLVLLSLDGKRAPGQRLGLNGTMRGFTFGQNTGYASLFDQGRIAVIDGATWKVKDFWAAGKSPRPVALAGTNLFVGDMGSAEVLVLDASTGKKILSVPVPSNPHAMVVSPNKDLVVVASRGRNNPNDYQLPGPDFGKLTVLDARGRVLGAVWGRNQPTGLAFSKDGKYLAFTDFLDNNVELYRVQN